MPTYSWDGMGLPDGTTVDATNINAAGNGTGTMVHNAGAAPATKVTSRNTIGNGLAIDGSGGGVARQDTNAISGGVACMAIQAIYVPTGAPTTADDDLFIGRNANASPGFTSYLKRKTNGTIEARNATNAAFTGSASVALNNAHAYQLDFATILNTSTTPTTSNGRIIARVRDLTDASSWNGGVEFFVDSGYAVNVNTDLPNQYRVGKLNTSSLHPAFKLVAIKWRDLATPDTSTVKANAITNFVQVTGPTITTTNTGTFYNIWAIGSGSPTYAIAQTGGNPYTPVLIKPGVWQVQQDTAGTRTYVVTVTDGSDTTLTVVVPQAGGTSGQFRRQVQLGGVLV